MDEFIRSKKYRSDERFVRYLAFGMIADQRRARQYARWFAECRAKAKEDIPQKDLASDNHAILNSTIRHLLTQAVLDSLPPVNDNRPLTLGLSSGYDSRGILFVLQTSAKPVNLYCFGQVGLLDFDFVRLLSEREKLDVGFFDTTQLDWSLEQYDEAIHSFQDFPLSPRVPTAVALNRAFGNRLEIHGHLNGNLTGQSSGKLMKSWQDVVADFSVKNDPFSFQRMLGRTVTGDLLPKAPLISPAALPLYRQLDMCYRLQQRIRPVSTKATQYLLPFEDPRWVGFWLSMDFAEIKGQRLYLAFLENLNSTILYDVNESKTSDRRGMRLHLLRLVYGERRVSLYARVARRLGLAKIPKDTPAHPTRLHFPLYVCFTANNRFRSLIGSAVDRLKGRRIFSSAFVEDVYLRFQQGNQQAEKLINGLVSTDILCQAGLL